MSVDQMEKLDLSSQQGEDNQVNNPTSKEEQDDQEIPPGMTRRDVAMMREAMGNPLVLHIIMRKLSFPTLQVCNKVNMIWNKVASEVIMKRDCSKVVLRYDGTRFGFVHRVFYSEHGQIPSLQDFTKLLQDSTNFPCTHFNFENGDLHTDDVQVFFELHGHLIKTLKLSDYNKYNPNYQYLRPPDDHKYLDTIFTDLIQPHAVNIESLTVDDFVIQWQDNLDSSEEQIYLPTLKNLDWTFQTDFRLSPEPILRGSTNLTSVTIDAMDNTSTQLKWYVDVAKTGKVKLIDKLWVNNDIFEVISDSADHFIQLANFRPPLTNLTLDELIDPERQGVITITNELKNAFQILFNGSSHSLEVLYLDQLCQLIPSVNIPPLPKLKRLGLEIESVRNRVGCLPPGLNLSLTFPNLHKLDLSELNFDADAQWDKYFPSTPHPCSGTLVTVEELITNQNWVESMMIKIRSGLCPNFKEIHVRQCDQMVTDFLSLVFRLWRNLTCIKIEIPHSLDPDLGHLNWDSVLTGLDPGVCDELLNMENNPTNHSKTVDERLKQLDNFPRNGSSVRELKDLTQLQIHHREYGLENNLMKLSIVSSLYALQLIPRLKVGVYFDHTLHQREGLKAVYAQTPPYINVRDEWGY